MLAREGEALELEAVEEVQRDERRELLPREALLVERVDVEAVDRVRGHRHDAQVEEEPFEALVIGLAHELEEDAVVEDPITLLPFAVLDVRPVFVVAVDVLQPVRVSLLVEHFEQCVLGEIGVVVNDERCGLACIRRHCVYRSNKEKQ